jgi:hypothetical protein
MPESQRENAGKIFVRKSERRAHWEHIGTDWRMILKWVLRN